MNFLSSMILLKKLPTILLGAMVYIIKPLFIITFLIIISIFILSFTNKTKLKNLLLKIFIIINIIVLILFIPMITIETDSDLIIIPYLINNTFIYILAKLDN